MKTMLQIGAVLAAVAAASLAFIRISGNAEPLLYAAVTCGALGAGAFVAALVRKSGGAPSALYFKAAATLAGAFLVVYGTIVAAWILAGLGLFGLR
jgi:hypothetical protein